MVMCGRVTLIDPSRVFAEFSLIRESPRLPVEARYNIAPSQTLAVVRAGPDQGARAVEWLPWGLIPSWTRQLAGARRPINVRLETLRDKAAFRSALVRRRCLVLTDGFYEWQRHGSTRQPYHIRRADRGALTLAGIWERWVAPDGEVVETCAVVTKPSLDPVRAIHDRMPAILESGDRASWLDATLVDERRLINLLLGSTADQPPPSPSLVMVPVATTVNAASSEGPACLAPPTGIQGNLFHPT